MPRLKRMEREGLPVAFRRWVWVLFLCGLMLGSPSGLRVWAVDPLPPELEHAPEEKKMAWRKKWAEDSARQKAQVAQQRYAERMAVKESMRAFQASLREEAVARSMPAPSGAAVAEATPEGADPTAPEEAGGYWGWILAAAIAAAGVWFLRRGEQDEFA